jgi:hypothetical protein
VANQEVSKNQIKKQKFKTNAKAGQKRNKALKSIHLKVTVKS